MIDDAEPLRNSRTDAGPRADNTMVVVNLDPVVVIDIKLGGIRLAHPERLAPARERQHAQGVPIRGVNMPFSVRRDVVETLLLYRGSPRPPPPPTPGSPPPPPPP